MAGIQCIKSFVALEYLERWPREGEKMARPVERVTVTADWANEGALRFYRRQGFEPRSVTLRYPGRGLGRLLCQRVRH